MANTTPHKSTKFVAIDLSGNARPEFINKKDIPRAYIVHRMDPQEVVDLNLILTPETILIGADQKVKKAWYGVLSPENLAELNKLLS